MFIENLKESFSCIFSNKMRSVLTMLGIIIGISSVITITTIGSSIKSTISSSMNSVGGSNVSVYVDAYYPTTNEAWENWEYPEVTDQDLITDKMIQGMLLAYPDEMEGVSVSAQLCRGTVYGADDVYANVDVSGVTNGYLAEQKLKILYGRSLTEEDRLKKRNVLLVSDIMAKQYFGSEEPLGKVLTIEDQETQNEYCYVVVGVYEYNEAVFGRLDTSVPPKERVTKCFAPVSAVNQSLGKNVSGYERLDVVLKAQADPKVAEQHIQSYLSQFYERNDKFQISTFSMTSQLGIIDTVINIVTIAISLIAAISLIVGGVGVMNIMLVSITERTKEIGVRMALGAKKRTIRTQFVIEAVVLCLIGGIIGILLGVLNGFLLGKIAGFVVSNFYKDYSQYIIVSVRPSLLAILLSLFFSMLTGIFFGSYPAGKAAKMEVIDALRYE